MRISDHVFFVTGASRGIGRAFVAELLGRGAPKVYAGVRDAPAVDEALRRDPRIQLIEVDVTNPEHIAAAAQTAADASVLINNAGIAVSETLLEGSAAAARRQFDTNVFGIVDMVRAFAPALRTRRGAVVNVLSAVAWFSAPDYGAYCASKAAAWSITNGLRLELAPQGVLVQGLHFGAVDTDFASGYEGPTITAHEVVAASVDGLEQDLVEVLVDSHSHAAKQALTGPPNTFLDHVTD